MIWHSIQQMSGYFTTIGAALFVFGVYQFQGLFLKEY